MDSWSTILSQWEAEDQALLSAAETKKDQLWNTKATTLSNFGT
jgi:hypothetical protein